VVVALRVVNTGSSTVSKSIALNVNGVDEAKKTVDLAPSQSKIITFNVTKKDAGTYTVKIGDLSSSFQVKGGSSTDSGSGLPQWVIIVIAVVGVIIVAVLIRILVMRSKGDY
jgi:hypothetical protein